MVNKSKLFLLFKVLCVLGVVVLMTSKSVWLPEDIVDRTRVFTRPLEFDYFYWTWQALIDKSEQFALGEVHYLTVDQQHAIVSDLMRLIQEIQALQNVIEQIYSNPQVPDPQQAIQSLMVRKNEIEQQYSQRAELAESILQYQIGQVLVSQGIELAGQPFPPILYRVSELPDQLIISPRNIIRQEAGISLQAGLPMQGIANLENEVEKKLDVSALVVPLGGVGVYPTMVYRTSDLRSMLEVVAHEWTHNYLTLRPLGWLYDATPQLRSMNETAAAISGKEISQLVMRRYYPEFLPAVPAWSGGDFAINWVHAQTDEPSFDFRKEMHITRVEVDELLKQGKVEEAEIYMETRRQEFWENGYQIRRINQAYFAFYGAYADEPLGPAGNDPVGPAVRLLRERSRNLREFLTRMAWMTSFEELQKFLNEH